MSNAFASGDPTTLMLRAALVRSDAALTAWQAVSVAGGLDGLDPDDQWLAPAAYWNLRTLGVPESDLTRLRATYRHHWLRNSLALRACLQTLDAMGAGGVAIGAAAVALTLASQHGAYPIRAIEVVGPSHFVAVSRAHWCDRDIAILAPADLLAQILLRHTDWDDRSRWLWVTAAVGVIRAHPDLDWSRVRAVAAAEGAERRLDVARRELSPFVGVAP